MVAYFQYCSCWLWHLFNYAAILKCARLQVFHEDHPMESMINYIDGNLPRRFRRKLPLAYLLCLGIIPVDNGNDPENLGSLKYHKDRGQYLDISPQSQEWLSIFVFRPVHNHGISQKLWTSVSSATEAMDECPVR